MAVATAAGGAWRPPLIPAVSYPTGTPTGTGTIRPAAPRNHRHRHSNGRILQYITSGPSSAASAKRILHSASRMDWIVWYVGGELTPVLDAVFPYTFFLVYLFPRPSVDDGEVEGEILVPDEGGAVCDLLRVEWPALPHYPGLGLAAYHGTQRNRKRWMTVGQAEGREILFYGDRRGIRLEPRVHTPSPSVPFYNPDSRRFPVSEKVSGGRVGPPVESISEAGLADRASLFRARQGSCPEASPLIKVWPRR